MTPAALRTPICDLLGCDQPVVLAGMGGVARSELVAAVTEAGGFGFLGMVREPPALIRREIEALRARTPYDFGVNLIPAGTAPELLQAELAVCIEAGVAAVALFWDLSEEIVRRLRDAGILVVCQVGGVREAEAAQKAGAHALIAQGWEAGGHVRGRTSLLSLVPEVVARVDIPVLAAGGIVDGQGLAAVLALGAQGAVVGTGFLATEESFAHDFHKRRILEAGPDETLHTEIFHINWPPGAPVRVLPNSVTRGERGDPFQEPKVQIGEEEGRPIYLFSTDSPLRNMTGDFEAMALYAGQSAGRIAEILPAGERLRRIVAEAEAILAGEGEAQAEEAPVAVSSPVCYAAEADPAYMGFADRGELLTLLGEALAMKRDRARVVLRSSIEAEDRDLARRLKALYEEDALSVGLLFEWIARLGGEAPRASRAAYKEALALSDPADRLALLDRQQRRAFDRLRPALPRIREEALRLDLEEILGGR